LVLTRHLGDDRHHAVGIDSLSYDGSGTRVDEFTQRRLHKDQS
jgi:hypothetical protein